MHEIKQLMAPTKPDPIIPALSYDHVPKSPPHRLEISDNDGGEVIDYAAAEASDSVNAKYVVAGMPMDFLGATCKHVCTQCILNVVVGQLVFLDLMTLSALGKHMAGLIMM